jgi:hypothetical protein
MKIKKLNNFCKKKNGSSFNIFLKKTLGIQHYIKKRDYFAQHKHANVDI